MVDVEKKHVTEVDEGCVHSYILGINVIL